MKKCPKCNKNMSDHSAFCDMCGSELEEVVEEVLESAPRNDKKPVAYEEAETLEEKDESLDSVEKKGRSFFEPVTEESEDQAFPGKTKPSKDEVEIDEKPEIIEVESYEETPEVEKNVNKPKKKKNKKKKSKKGQEIDNNKKEEKIEDNASSEKKEEVIKEVLEQPEIEMVEDVEMEPEVETIEEEKEPKDEKTEEVEEFEFQPVPEPETVPETVPTTKLKKKKKKSKNVPVTVPETVPETEPKTEPETVPETEPETVPETELETAPATTPVEPTTVPQQIYPVLPVTPQQDVVYPVITPVTQPDVVYPVIPAVTQPDVIYPVIPAVSQTVDPDIEEDSSDGKHDIKIKISLIIGIVAILLGGMWPLAVVGLIVGFVSPENSNKKTNAMLVNAIAIALGVIVMIVFFSAVQSGNGQKPSGDMKQFYGDDYTISYSVPWKEVTLSDDRKALRYGEDESFFYPVGSSSLDITINCDFTEDSCKTETYNSFYDYWKSSIDDSLVLSRDSSFVLLKGDIYYATYNYAVKDTNEAKGKYYLVISKKKNVVLSFISSGIESELADLNPNIIKILNTIEIKSKTKQDKNKTEVSDQLSNWNMYANLRQDTKGRKKVLNGSYRILADTTSFWVFKNGEFWWYRSEDQLDDNYWYGTYTVKTGKKGLKSVGLKEDNIDTLLKQGKGKISESDINSITLIPKKIIYDGVDKSDTNVRKGSKWRFVWIIVDHGDDGIEAQVFSADTYDVSYFVKVSD